MKNRNVVLAFMIGILKVALYLILFIPVLLFHVFLDLIASIVGIGGNQVVANKLYNWAEKLCVTLLGGWYE